MATAEQTAAGIDRDGALHVGVTLPGASPRGAGIDEPQRFDRDQFADREGVVDFGDVDIGRRDPGGRERSRSAAAVIEECVRSYVASMG